MEFFLRIDFRKFQIVSSLVHWNEVAHEWDKASRGNEEQIMDILCYPVTDEAPGK